MLILTFIFSFFTVMLTAPPNQVIYIERGEPVNPYEKIWKAICQVESNNNPYAVGDKHLRKHSYGISQIREERLKDYYNKTGIYYTKKDCFDINKSKTVFLFYASDIGPNNMEKIARCWNGGNNGMKLKQTRKYYLRVKKIL